MADSDDERSGLSEAIIKAAVALGASETKMRWRVQRLSNRWRSMTRRGEQRLEQVRYANKICPSCRSINAAGDKRCSECGARLGSRAWQVLDRVGLVVPEMVSASTLLGVCFIAVYARIMFAQTGGSPWGLTVYDLARFGGNFGPLTLDGEQWRLLSSIVSHGGIVHLAFNLIALYIVGPEVEQRYGRFVMPLLFAVCGVAGSLASAYLSDPPAVAIGASGGIMGLIGATAVRAHREGDRDLRDRMIKWIVYTGILGFAIAGIDNWAHIGGLACGAALGLALSPRAIAPHSIRVPLSLLGVAATAAAVWLAVSPPASALDKETPPSERAERFDPVSDVYRPAAEACDLATSDPVEATRRIEAIAARVGETPGPDPLDRWCAQIEQIRATCRDSRLAAEQAQLDLQQQRDNKRICAAVGAPLE